MSEVGKPYEDGEATHHMKGTIVPRSHARSEWTGSGLPQTNDGLHANADIEVPIPYNVFEYDKASDSMVKVAHITSDMTLKMREVNHKVAKDKVVGYVAIEKMVKEQALVKHEEPVEAEPVEEATPVPEPAAAAAPPHALDQAALGGITGPGVEADVITLPRVKVKISGPFGSIVVPFVSAYQHGIFLVLVQFDEDRMFYEPPTGDPGEEPKVLSISFGGKTYHNVLVIAHFPLCPGSPLAVNVFAIGTAS